MKKLAAGLLLVLALAGCSSTTDAPSSASPTPSAAAEVGVSSAADITDLESGAEYALSLKADTPNLLSEMSATAIRLGDLIGADDTLPFDVHNEVGQDLVSLNADILNGWSDPASRLPDLYAIAGMLQGSL
jgi:hypothetical protein